MLDVRQKIAENLKRAIKTVTGKDIVPELSHPTDERHGDYSTNIALALFSNQESGIRNQEWKSPLELAKKIADQFIIHNSRFLILSRVEAVKPGFINFFLSKDYLIANLEKILGGNKYGSKLQNPNKKIVVEYSSPNIAKPFTVGHLRSTIIGDAVANLLEANGWKVYRDNHIGDWGTQFGKQIAALKYISLKDGRVSTNDSNILKENMSIIEKSDNKVKILVKLYQDFHKEAEKNKAWEGIARAEFKELEDGISEYRILWKKCVEWSLKEFQKIYDQLGIRFTENNGIGYGESFFEDKMQAVIKELENKGILKESEGAKLVFFPSFGSFDKAQDKSAQDKYPPLMIVKKDGATLYATRDLATDKFRLKKYGKDVVIINEVGIEQSLYFKQLFEVEKMLGWVKDGQRIHLKHGHYRFSDEKMSTRKGNVIWLEVVLEEGIRRAYKLSSEEARKTAKDVAIGAIKWNDLKRGSNLDIIFDWDEILNMEGNSGPYLQYSFARTKSVLRKASINVMPNSFRHLERSEILKQVQDDKLIEHEELSLLRAVYRFPEVVEEAAESFSPNLLCNYLFDLAQKFNLFYQKLPILESEQREFRLALTAAVGQVIKNGLDLLGIQAPERM